MKYTYILVLLLSSVSCSVHNRMTSPEVLDKTERIWTFGGSLDPLAITELGAIEDPLALFQPVIGYRSGLGKGQELGISLYGLVGPAIVIDHKHNLFERNRFALSGDIAAFGGIERPVGGQYDLIFGTQKIYGTIGFGYDAIHVVSEAPYYQLGLGSQRINGKAFGFQIAFAQSLAVSGNDADNYLSIGLKMDILKNRKSSNKE